jgi:hypothetical protein
MPRAWRSRACSMAKRSSGPLPAVNLPLKLHVWPTTTRLERIHPQQYAGTEFNPGLAGNARFSPICRTDRSVIPTMYAGNTFQCAAMETVFHDVPYVPGRKRLSRRLLATAHHATLETNIELQLIDLRAMALRSLGIRRDELIDTEADQYAFTRLWAEAIYQQHGGAHGLLWTSRQDDSSLSLVLFGDRLPPGGLVQVGKPRHLLNDDDAYEQIQAIAEYLGVDLVP